MMAKFIFLCGSSSVGKTGLMEAMPESYEGCKIETVRMDFSSIREALGSPSWEDLASKPDILEAQQTAGMAIYEARIQAFKSTAVPDTIYLFERSPLDIAGYSFAFGGSNEHVHNILDRAFTLLDLCTNLGDVLIVNRPVDVSFEYDRRNNTRPSYDVRMRCDLFLSDQCRHYGNLHLPNLNVYTSVNQGQSEIDRILKYVN